MLIVGWGNLSRGDDAQGPLLLDALHLNLPERFREKREFLEKFQLKIEHALALVGRTHVLLVDATLTGAAPFEVIQPHAEPAPSYTTDALSPQWLLHRYQEVHATPPLPCSVLVIRDERFEWGEVANTLCFAEPGRCDALGAQRVAVPCCCRPRPLLCGTLIRRFQ